MSGDRFQVIHADSVEGLLGLADNSVDLVLTSPPYDALRSYSGHCNWDFRGTADQLTRVLAPGGVICWVVNDSTIGGSETCTSCDQKIYFHRRCRLRIHDTMIYQKLNFSHPEKIRYHQIFEYVFVFTKGEIGRFNPLKDRKNVMGGRMGSVGRNTATQVDNSKVLRRRKTNTEFGMRHNIWAGKTRGQEEMCKKLERPAMMPRWLARDLILSFSDVDDVVLDPFSGSFTSCAEALKLNRRAIGIDVDAHAVAIGKKLCQL